MQDLLSMQEIDKKEIEAYLSEAERMERLLPGGTDALKGKIIANLFFEPSTRTNISFQAAAKRLGADVILFSQETSSAAKGESFSDTIRIIDGYADAIVIRHPEEGSAHLAAGIAAHPVINAGDGGNEHPTQALIDLYTINKLKGKIEGLNITLFGDLKHARAMRSLLFGLAMFGANISLVSPPSLRMDEKLLQQAKKKYGANISEAAEPNLKNADVLYMCRVQKERFKSKKEAQIAAKAFSLTKELLAGANKEMVILHPLPRREELPVEVDSDPKAKYFEQAKNGVPVRMAVLKRCVL